MPGRVDEWMPYPKESYGVLAPEAMIGLRVVPQSDIYGMAVTLWEVLHGQSHSVFMLMMAPIAFRLFRQNWVATKVLPTWGFVFH